MVILDKPMEEEESDATKKARLRKQQIINQDWRLDWTRWRTTEEWYVFYDIDWS